jgi:hypothetical protein
MSTEVRPNAQDDLPVCPFCGSHGELIDLHEKARRMGVAFANDKPMYSIICCGYYLPIADASEHESLVEYLKKSSS